MADNGRGETRWGADAKTCLLLRAGPAGGTEGSRFNNGLEDDKQTDATRMYAIGYEEDKPE